MNQQKQLLEVFITNINCEKRRRKDFLTSRANKAVVILQQLVKCGLGTLPIGLTEQTAT